MREDLAQRIIDRLRRHELEHVAEPTERIASDPLALPIALGTRSRGPQHALDDRHQLGRAMSDMRTELGERVAEQAEETEDLGRAGLGRRPENGLTMRSMSRPISASVQPLSARIAAARRAAGSCRPVRTVAMPYMIRIATGTAAARSNVTA